MSKYSFEKDNQEFTLTTPKGVNVSSSEALDIYNEFKNNKILPEGYKLAPSLRGKTSIISPRLSPVLSGVSSAFADDFAGGLQGLLSKDLTIGEGAVLADKTKDFQRQNFPIQSTIEEGAGFFANPLGRVFSKFEKGKSKKARIGTRVIEGGIYGVGEGEVILREDGKINVPETLQSKGLNAARDTFISGVFNTIAVPLGDGASNLISLRRSRASKLGKKRAEKELRELIETSGQNIDTFFENVIKKNKKGYSLIDAPEVDDDQMMIIAAKVLGENNKARDIRNFFKNRNNTLNKRVKSELEIAFPETGLRFETLKKLLHTRGVKADAIYKIANAKKINIKNDIEFQNIISKPDFEEAFERALTLAKLDGVKMPKVFIKNGKIVDGKNNEIIEMKTELLHYIKMGYGKALQTGKAKGEVAIDNTEKGIRTRNLNDYLSWLDSKNPAYKKARDEFAGDSEVIKALDDGYNFQKIQTVEELQYIMDNLSKSEKTSFQQGVYNFFEQRLTQTVNTGVEGMGANPALNVIKTPNNRDFLRIILGKSEGDKLINNLTDIVKMKNTSNSVLNKSNTAEKISRANKIITESKDIANMSKSEIIKKLISTKDVASKPELYQRGYADRVYEFMTAASPEELLKIKSDIKISGYDKVYEKIVQTLIATGKISQQAIIGNPTSLIQETSRNIAEDNL